MANNVDPSLLPKSYEATQVEQKWYDFWLQNKYFRNDENSTKPKFSMVIPPPNVTGVLHMGHALNNSLQDILARFKRMNGFDVLWIPGTDHAGISTQIVVEKQLAKEGIKREHLGREKFVEKVWEWKEKSGGMIQDQQKRLGLSVDWEKSRFTLDEGLSKAVRKVFVDLYNQNLIYRGTRLVNWCPRCQTAISDLEVKHSETKGSLWHIRYPFVDNPSEFVTVATTRPETMLGDTAVAVNPKDVRYKKWVGKKVLLPLVNREIPVIADESVESEFGSGIVKITPAHDFNDYETGTRHKLPMISIFDSKGVINETGGPYKGIKGIPDARKRVIEDLTAQGLFVKEEPHTLSVGKCERCETIVEPMLSLQWFVKIQTLAAPATKAVEEKKIKFIPENWTKTYLDWMYNIKDWTISRQLWWGHRIPAWYCRSCEKVTVSMADPTECIHCQSKEIFQDPDVLDTWFSSQLWPFSTMGWPDNTKTLERYYPTDVLVTAFDIIFFWVARMAMAGIHFMKEVPFHTVYIHALVRDERGQKMSKSKGNVVDPLGLVSEYGTDALRFTLASLVGAGRDIKFSEDRLDGYRNFINKIWNATRFSLTALHEIDIVPKAKIDPKKLSLPDLYILNELKKTIETATLALNEYRFTDAANTLYKFAWNEFCDWYLELSKPVLYGTHQELKANSGRVLIEVLGAVVKLLHPFIPFVTEEIYESLRKRDVGFASESIMREDYPSAKDPLLALASDEASSQIEIVKSVVTAIRNIRGENRINPGEKIVVRFSTESVSIQEILRKNEHFIVSLARLSKAEYTLQKETDTKKCAVSLVTLGKERIQVIIPLEGLVDFGEEIKRLQKEKEKTQKDYQLTESKLSTETFVKNAPPEIVTQERERLSQLKDRLAAIAAGLERLSQ